MNVIFFGSSPFSLNALKACEDAPEVNLVGVITTPPKKKGRGLDEKPTIIAEYCNEKKIPYKEYKSLKNEESLEETKALQPDLFVVSSYGKLIPDSFLELAKLRLNVHPSLLPLHRGASPINWPIIQGEAESGLSIADVTKDLDAGDIYYQETFPLSSTVNAHELSIELSNRSYDALCHLFKKIDNFSLPGKPQNHEKSTYARKLEKKDGLISFTDTAQNIERKIRGLFPWPGTYYEGEPGRIVITEARIKTQESVLDKPGVILEIDEKSESLIVAAGEGTLEILKLKPAGKKEMTGSAFARGRQLKPGIKYF